MSEHLKFYLEKDNPGVIQNALDRIKIESQIPQLPGSIPDLIKDLLSLKLIKCEGQHANKSGGAALCPFRSINTGCGHSDRLFALLIAGSEIIGNSTSSITYQPQDFSSWNKLVVSNLNIDRLIHQRVDRDEEAIKTLQKKQHELVIEEVHYLIIQLLQIENPI